MYVKSLNFGKSKFSYLLAIDRLYWYMKTSLLFMNQNLPPLETNNNNNNKINYYKL